MRNLTRRRFCAAAAGIIASPLGLAAFSRRALAMTDVMSEVETGSQGEASDIRPFHPKFADADITELRRRVNATRWPERETVPDASQGVQLATIQALARYWATEYDWRKIEAKLK